MYSFTTYVWLAPFCLLSAFFAFVFAILVQLGIATGGGYSRVVEFIFSILLPAVPILPLIVLVMNIVRALSARRRGDYIKFELLKKQTKRFVIVTLFLFYSLLAVVFTIGFFY
jgi:hypothetical protein